MKILKLFSGLTKKNLLVDMYNGDFGFPSWITTIVVREGNGIRVSSGEELMFQYTTISIATNREAQLQEEGESAEKIKISDIFPQKEVVMVTRGDSIEVISPIFDNKKEMQDYLGFVKYVYPQRYEDTVKLAEFLYRNNPDKKD